MDRKSSRVMFQSDLNYLKNSGVLFFLHFSSNVLWFTKINVDNLEYIIQICKV